MKRTLTNLILIVNLLLTLGVAEVSANSNLEVKGRVVDADSGEPLEGVTVLAGVTFNGLGETELRMTGRNGEFTLESIRTPPSHASSYSDVREVVVIYHPGYVGFTMNSKGERPKSSTPCSVSSSSSRWKTVPTQMPLTTLR